MFKSYAISGNLGTKHLTHLFYSFPFELNGGGICKHDCQRILVLQTTQIATVIILSILEEKIIFSDNEQSLNLRWNSRKSPWPW